MTTTTTEVTTLTRDTHPLTCAYVGALAAREVTIDPQQPAGRVRATLVIDLPYSAHAGNTYDEHGTWAVTAAMEFVRVLNQLTGHGITLERVTLPAACAMPEPEPVPTLEPLRAFTVELVREARVTRQVTQFTNASMKHTAVVLASSQDEAERLAQRAADRIWEAADLSVMLDEVDADDADWEIDNTVGDGTPEFERWVSRGTEIEGAQDITDEEDAVPQVESAEIMGTLVVRTRHNPDGSVREEEDEVKLFTDTLDAARIARESGAA